MAILTGIDCTENRLGTGLESCQAVAGLPTGFILVPKGWSLNKTSGSFDFAYVTEQIQLGNFVPFVNTFQMTGATPEPTTQESQSGIMSVVRQGKPTFTAIFKKGRAFQAAAYSYNSDNQYDFLLTFETGYVLAVESVDGTEVKGLTVGMLNTNGYGENDGTNSEQTTMMFQVTDPLEYNRYTYLLTALDFNPNALNGITNINMVITSANVSSAAVVFSAVWKFNEQFPVTGLSETDVNLTCNGVVNAFTALTYSPTTKLYTGTPTSVMVATQSAIVNTKGSIADDVAKLGNKYYKGISPAKAIVA